MTGDQLRQKYLDFFAARGHAVIPSAPLVPQNDPSTLFTTCGMQPLVPYLLGETHPKGTRLTNSQKSFRSQDIEEVGDNRHTTFFEMLGNWSLGDYFKKDQLGWFFQFLTDKNEGLGLDPNKLYATVFSGDPDTGVPRDDEAISLWEKLFASAGISAQYIELHTDETGYSKGMQGGRVFGYDVEKNWWSRSGVPANMPAGEPGGPDSEVFYDFGLNHDPKWGQHCHPNCDCGRFLEIGNSVFMQFKKQADGSLIELPNKNVDFGGGLERMLAALADDPDVFSTDLFSPIIKQLEQISGKKYQDTSHTNSFRVVADHLKAAVLLAADGVYPGNKEQGYFSRRLIRRAVRHGNLLGIDQNFTADLAPVVAQIYKQPYPEVSKNLTQIQNVLRDEETRFRKTLVRGLKEFEKYVTVGDVGKPETKRKMLDPKSVFNLYQTYGFPYELTKEEAGKLGIEIPSKEEFDQELKEHQDLSRTASAGMFKGGLADHSQVVTKLHTATHLLHAALRNVLGTHVRQEGSNITADRLRFDFSHPQALTDEETQKVESEINAQIKANLPVVKTIEDRDKALESGAMAFFKEKYPDKVSVYTIGEPGNFYSKEFCGGPHVSSTGQIGAVTIKKQESIGAGKRRIYAVLAK